MSRSVAACSSEAWHLRYWQRDAKPDANGELPATAAPFKCRSMRHEGECRRWRASRQFARISAALGDRNPESVLMVVLTLNQGDWIAGDTATASDRFEAFKALRSMWQVLSLRLKRDLGARVEYVSTVEITRSGWPHLNIILVSDELGARVAADQKAALSWFKLRAISAGFGYMASMEHARSLDAVAGYIVKLSGEMTGEVVKLSQAPVNAPKNFRALRSSKGFLPAPYKQEGWTGTLLRSPCPSPLPKQGSRNAAVRSEKQERETLPSGGNMGRNGVSGVHTSDADSVPSGARANHEGVPGARERARDRDRAPRALTDGRPR